MKNDRLRVEISATDNLIMAIRNTKQKAAVLQAELIVEIEAARIQDAEKKGYIDE